MIRIIDLIDFLGSTGASPIGFGALAEIIFT